MTDDEQNQRIRENMAVVMAVMDKLRVTNDVALACAYFGLTPEQQLTIQTWAMAAGKVAQADMADVIGLMLRAKK